MTQPHRTLDHAMIVLATCLGAGSILLLVALDTLTFTSFGWNDTAILAWDAFLSLLFFLQHSIMVRRSFKQRLARTIPPRYHGAVYTIASGIVLTLLVIFWQKTGTVLYELNGIARWAMYGCLFLVIVVFVLSIHALRSFDPLGLGPIRAHLRGVEPQPSPFVVRGPYHWVRHPLYSCVVVLFWATPVLSPDRLLFNVLWTAWVGVGTLLEERDLTREFGEAYIRYKEQVPMFVPWRVPQTSATRTGKS